MRLSEDHPMFAAGELNAVQEAVALAMRILLSVIGTALGWVLAAPVARIAYRLLMRRPIPPKVLTGSRMVAAIVCGVLVFLLFPLGYGGTGRGNGWGTGSEAGRGKDKGSDKGRTGKGDKGPEMTEKPGKTLRIEMIPSNEYKQGSERYYLINGKEPARTLAEVEEYVKLHKESVDRLRLIIPANGPDPGNPAVRNLEKLAQRNGLFWYPELEPPAAGKHKQK